MTLWISRCDKNDNLTLKPDIFSSLLILSSLTQTIAEHILPIFTPVKNLLFLCLITFFSFQQAETDSGLATVERQMGVGVYVYALPVRPYDTVCLVKTKSNFVSYPGPSLTYKVLGIQGAVDDLARKTLKKAKKNKAIDGLITMDCQQAIAIAFKSEASTANYNKAKPKQYKGYWVFVQCKPAKSFTVEKTVALSTKLDMQKDQNVKFEQLLDELIRLYEASFDSVKPRANAIVTNNGIEADFILFK